MVLGGGWRSKGELNNAVWLGMEGLKSLSTSGRESGAEMGVFYRPEFEGKMGAKTIRSTGEGNEEGTVPLGGVAKVIRDDLAEGGWNEYIIGGLASSPSPLVKSSSRKRRRARCPTRAAIQ